MKREMSIWPFVILGVFILLVIFGSLDLGENVVQSPPVEQPSETDNAEEELQEESELEGEEEAESEETPEIVEPEEHTDVDVRECHNALRYINKANNGASLEPREKERIQECADTPMLAQDIIGERFQSLKAEESNYDCNVANEADNSGDGNVGIEDLINVISSGKEKVNGVLSYWGSVSC